MNQMLAPCQAKKLVLVLATFLSIIVTSIEAVQVDPTINESTVVFSFEPPTLVIDNLALPFEFVPCIYHLLWFKKDQIEVQALLDSNSKVNVMIPAYAVKLGLKVQLTDVGAQKINGSSLKIFGIVLVSFQINKKLARSRFF